ncbi:MAG TPA: Cas9 inhibitor AcrIIA9 family protein [Oscillospiraceae bacterium]|nr:Cas9 inhibitor AcrIIA9 family protein [Oscillospiraceae bacterium]
MIAQAIEKINKELKEFKGGQGQKAQCADTMKSRCADILKSFCEQNEEFAQAVVQTDRTLSDCISAVVNKFWNKARKDGISDLEAFKTMGQFYFPGSGVHCTMTIDVEANEPVETFDVPANTAEADEPDDINDDDDEEAEQEEPAVAPAPKAEKKKSLSFNLDDFI